MEDLSQVQYRFPRRTVAALTFSFDDGLAEQFTEAVPMMAEYGLKGTFFVVAGAVGTERQMRAFPSQLPGVELMPEREIASWRDIREAHNAGHEIGAHSWGHRLPCTQRDHLATVGDARGAQEEIAGRVGTKPTSWAWPYYIRGPAIQAAIVESRYETIRGRYRTLNLKTGSSPGRVRAWIDKAIENEDWYFFVIHGVGIGTDRVKADVLRHAMAYAIKRRRKIWVAPAREVQEFLAETTGGQG